MTSPLSGAELQSPWHLTALPWTPLAFPKSAYLDVIEGICRFSATHQDARGAIIDPFLRREHQYSTPYFAYAVAVLTHAGHAPGLLPAGVRAMNHATEDFAKGADGIPDQHGEFFIAALTEALALYKNQVPEETIQRWRGRMTAPIAQVVLGVNLNNWRTFAMKGEWLRAEAGLVERSATQEFIEDAWHHQTQRGRMAGDTNSLYEDRSSDPDSLAVEAVGRGNLLALTAAGYDGPSAGEIARLAERGTLASLQLQDPSGQCPPNGRTDDHVFNDVVYQLAFEVMAERMGTQGDLRLAGQYRRAALLSFGSIARWCRTDGSWKGSYFVTKNHFDPAERVGYQPASNYGNYNGAVMFHLAEAYQTRRTEIAEQPAPVEIGGYALVTDPHFSAVSVNAGGMQMIANLRGDTQPAFDNYWTPLGVARFGRAGWDCRLGPSDGVRDVPTGLGVSFAPTWPENGDWVRLADVPDRYRGDFSVQFAHPLLVRCAVDYRPKPGRSGPAFRHEFTLTPDGILARLSSPDTTQFGVTWPLLENDGRPLVTSVSAYDATTHYADSRDEQSFLALHPGAEIFGADPPVRSTYGWLRPLRVTAPGNKQDTLVYPHGAGQPDAAALRSRFQITADGFSSSLGRVAGSLYVGQTAAGGEGDHIDLNGDGKAEVTFAHSCRFVLQLESGKVTAVEVDRPVTAMIEGRRLSLTAHTPRFLR